MNHWWTAIPPGKSHLALVDFSEFERLVRKAKPHRHITKVILHHTWKPPATDYRGADTWHGIRRYHVETNGWSDIGYHLGIAPDETIWLLRPLQRTGAHCLGQNERSIGVVMLGNFDVGHDSPGAALKQTAECVGILCERFGLDQGDVYFHRDFADKSCPGTGIERAHFRALVAKAGQAPPPSIPFPFRVIEHATGRVLWPSPDETWQVAEGGDHIEDQGKVYVR